MLWEVTYYRHYLLGTEILCDTQWVMMIAIGLSTNTVCRVVGIATGYGLECLRIESRWGRDFLQLSRPSLGPTQPSVQWVPGLSRGKEQPERDADPSSPYSAVVMKE